MSFSDVNIIFCCAYLHAYQSCACISFSNRELRWETENRDGTSFRSPVNRFQRKFVFLPCDCVRLNVSLRSFEYAFIAAMDPPATVQIHPTARDMYFNTVFLWQPIVYVILRCRKSNLITFLNKFVVYLLREHVIYIFSHQMTR